MKKINSSRKQNNNKPPPPASSYNYPTNQTHKNGTGLMSTLVESFVFGSGATIGRTVTQKAIDSLTPKKEEKNVDSSNYCDELFMKYKTCIKNNSDFHHNECNNDLEKFKLCIKQYDIGSEFAE